jgi:hypothetical protein
MICGNNDNNSNTHIEEIKDTDMKYIAICLLFEVALYKYDSSGFYVTSITE